MTLCFFLVCVCVCVSVRMQMPCATSSSPWFITSVISCLSPEDPGKVHTVELLINFVHKWSTSPNSWTGDCSGSVLTQRYKVNLMLSCLLVQTSASWFFFQCTGTFCSYHSWLADQVGGAGILLFGVKPKSFRMLWGFGLISILKVYLNMLSTRLTKKNTFQPTSRTLIGSYLFL